MALEAFRIPLKETAIGVADYWSDLATLERHPLGVVKLAP
jgi:hypothetical protein